MREYIQGFITTFCVGLMITGFGPDAPPATGLTLDGEVIRVVDGDTIVVESRVRYHVRLLDCWCAESRMNPRIADTLQMEEKAKGLAAKDHLNQIADGKIVIVHIPIEDGDISKVWTMGRVLGNVWLKSDKKQSLSEKQVESGHATKEKPRGLK